MTRWGLVCAALLAWACTGGDQAGERVQCYGHRDCPEEHVCFLGTCVESGYSISSVYAEIIPPNDSSLLAQQTAEPVSLSTRGPSHLYVLPTLTLEGSVTRAGAGLDGTVYATAPGPVRSMVRQAPVSQGVFSLPMVAGSHALRFVPAAVDAPSEALPPVSMGALSVTSHATLDYPYPTALVTVTGKVRRSGSVQHGVAGAKVSAVARTALDEPLESTAATTGVDGSYTLVAPPGAESFDVSVRAGTNPEVPERKEEGLWPDGSSVLPDVVLGLDDPRQLAGSVLAEGDGPVEGASVVFDGMVGADGQGRFVLMATTNSLGQVVVDLGDTKLLAPGDYTVTVAPRRTQPYAMSSVRLSLESGETGQLELPLTVGTKVQVSGRVLSSGGRSRVANAQLTFTLLQSGVSRQLTAITDSDGRYSVGLDPSSGELRAKYEVTVTPPTASGWPLHRELWILDDGGERNIVLHESTFVYGTIYAPDGKPVANASLAFYSDELGNGPAPLLVGLGESNSSGEFVVPLPTPPNP